MHKMTRVEALEDYRKSASFADGTRGVVDLFLGHISTVMDLKRHST